MPLPFDATLKTLFEQYPEDWLRLLDLPADGPVTIINADASTFSSQADKVIQIDGPRPWLLHAELQATRDDSLPDRTLQANVIVSVRHKLRVKSVVVLLRQEAEEKRRPLSGVLQWALPHEGLYLTFQYAVVRVWQLPPETFLSGGLGLLLLAPIGKVTTRGLAKVIRRMEARIGSETNKATAADLWTATYVLMGLRYAPPVVAEVLKGVRGLEESTTYQEIIKIGEARGLAEGEARGLAEGARISLLRVGRKRLGEPDAATQDVITALTDVEQIEMLIERVLEVETWDELFAPQNT